MELASVAIILVSGAKHLDRDGIDQFSCLEPFRAIRFAAVKQRALSLGS
jgi:hypothetical protein